MASVGVVSYCCEEGKMGERKVLNVSCRKIFMNDVIHRFFAHRNTTLQILTPFDCRSCLEAGQTSMSSGLWLLSP